MKVTRLEISDHILEAFDHPPASREDVLAKASQTHARPEVLAALQALPDQPFPNLRAIWPHLPNVPVDA